MSRLRHLLFGLLGSLFVGLSLCVVACDGTDAAAQTPQAQPTQTQTMQAQPTQTQTLQTSPTQIRPTVTVPKSAIPDTAIPDTAIPDTASPDTTPSTPPDASFDVELELAQWHNEPIVQSHLDFYKKKGATDLLDATAHDKTNAGVTISVLDGETQPSLDYDAFGPFGKVTVKLPNGLRDLPTGNTKLTTTWSSWDGESGPAYVVNATTLKTVNLAMSAAFTSGSSWGPFLKPPPKQATNLALRLNAFDYVEETHMPLPADVFGQTVTTTFTGNLTRGTGGAPDQLNLTMIVPDSQYGDIPIGFAGTGSIQTGTFSGTFSGTFLRKFKIPPFYGTWQTVAGT